MWKGARTFCRRQANDPRGLGPQMAYEAMKLEPKVGAMLPCNVIVRAINGGDIMVSAIDPNASMQAIDNDMLKSLVGKNPSMLEDVVAEF
ncbi:DUF302 domain-containing protein [Rhizobium fabae]|uniref:DUF302 domain-containing protein n=2 Tax=Rhizobium fabae TaxID=573179 RepID=A0ABY0B449_9HYPH|nr:DUF302 domain-containing protein [Rhizobium fabae]